MANFEIEGFPSNPIAFAAAANLAENTKKGTRRALFAVGKELVSAFNDEVLRGKKTGKIYIRKDSLGRRRQHQASAGGESPANRSGNYRKEIGFKNQTTQLIFGNRAQYAGWLEVGTTHMKARPGLGNAVDASQRDILRDLADGISKAI